MFSCELSADLVSVRNNSVITIIGDMYQSNSNSRYFNYEFFRNFYGEIKLYIFSLE